jgi:hypothetical protein
MWSIAFLPANDTLPARRAPSSFFPSGLKHIIIVKLPTGA